MGTRTPFAPGEWYHCYNRGVDKRRVFQNRSEYERFLLLMYVSNGSNPVHISNLKKKGLLDVLTDPFIEKGEPIVEIGAYCLMPNHVHFSLKEIKEGGITLFMQKIFTGYTMYFNKKNERTGALFAGTFKSKHVGDDLYMKWLLSYIHLNPAELIDSRWKEGRGNISKIKKFLSSYPYSSFRDFSGGERVERKLLGGSVFELFDTLPPMSEMVEEAHAYHQERNIKV